MENPHIIVLPTLEETLQTHDYTPCTYADAYEIHTNTPGETLIVWEDPHQECLTGKLFLIGGTAPLTPSELNEILNTTQNEANHAA